MITFCPFLLQKKKDAEKALDVLARSSSTDIKDLYVDEFFSIPSTEIDAFIATMESIVDNKEQRKALEAEREVYLRKNPDEYWNSEKEEILKRPIPAWGRFDEGWWRHITPEMFEAHADHYRELFKELGGGMLRALASRAPNLMGEYQRNRIERRLHKQLQE